MASDTPRTDLVWRYQRGKITDQRYIESCKLERALAAKSAEVIALRQALSQILGWRELRDSNAFPIERVEAIARAALQSTERGEHG